MSHCHTVTQGLTAGHETLLATSYFSDSSVEDRSFDNEERSVSIPGGGGQARFDLPVPVGQAFVVVGKQQNLPSESVV